MVNVVGSDKWSEVEAQDTAVVDFNATWCGPCKMMAPVLEELSGDYEGKVSFYAIDVDENPDLAEKFSVMSIPNLVEHQRQMNTLRERRGDIRRKPRYPRLFL